MGGDPGIWRERRARSSRLARPRPHWLWEARSGPLGGPRTSYFGCKKAPTKRGLSFFQRRAGGNSRQALF
jgi:hypothetical protein